MKTIVSLIAVALLSACSMSAPKYQPSTDNSNLLQDITSNKVSVTPFGQSGPEVDNLTLRGGSMTSPYNGSYSEYVSNALEEELKLAGIWGQQEDIQITGTLIDNQIDISGFSVGTASISVQFVVKRDNKPVFDKVISIKHEWPSSFVGAVAIPAGVNNYPIMLQKLFAELFKDEQFIKSVS